jgi:hypothetical protein
VDEVVVDDVDDDVVVVVVLVVVIDEVPTNVLSANVSSKTFLSGLLSTKSLICAAVVSVGSSLKIVFSVAEI